ncbi:dethiobiotin synthase [Phenylobacterium sp. LjRoot225]|uniref:dethiobiotin synthase n=1 Tax=Phenylobacterium sp. LjRoot225 TaxID=3342285 RepID=UPI003ED006AE
MAAALSSTALFVAGAHTDVGKTHVACALIRAARARNLTCDAFKPVLSGFDPARWRESDAGRLIEALGREEADLDAVSPLRFSAPLAPPVAARREGQRLAKSALLARCRTWLAASPAQLKLLEGAGGLMSPIAEDGTALDLPEYLSLPSILVGGAYLGAVSHVLTALEVMRARHLRVIALVISEDASPEAPSFDDTVAMVRKFAGPVPVVSVRRDDERPWAEALLQLVLA